MQLLSQLKKLRELTKEAWSNGVYTAETIEGTIQLNAKALGKAEILEDLINITYEDLLENLD
jgi:hypothetical protein